MSEEQGTGVPNEGETKENKERSIESVTAEFSRKTAKLSEENSKMSQQLEKLLNYVESQRAASTSQTTSNQESEDKLEDLAYTNPKLYAQKVKDMAKREALSAVSQTFAEQQRTNTVLGQLAADYPELNDNNSELTKKAVEIYKSMSDSDRTSPISYKVAVRDAAAELGILTKNKRSKSSSDEPNISAGGIPSELNKKSGSSSSNKLDEKTLQIASLMGLDISDKKVVESLTKRSQRKNWGKYE
jgi:hypothetical protein